MPSGPHCPSYRVRVQVADGDIDSAKRTASRSLPADGHESAAAFMASMSDRGARQALDLPGVSIRSKLMLSIQAGQLSRAQRYLQALAAGATDHASLKGLMRPSVSSNQSSASPSPLEMTPRSGSPSGLLTPSSRSDDGGDDLLGLDKGQSGGSGSGWGGMLLGAAARKAKGVRTRLTGRDPRSLPLLHCCATFLPRRPPSPPSAAPLFARPILSPSPSLLPLRPSFVSLSSLTPLCLMSSAGHLPLHPRRAFLVAQALSLPSPGRDDSLHLQWQR